jgi:hypothetical protein
MKESFISASAISWTATCVKVFFTIGYLTKVYDTVQFIFAHLKKPFVLYFNGVPHELLGGEDQLVVDDPTGQVLEQGGVRMNHYLDQWEKIIKSLAR